MKSLRRVVVNTSPLTSLEKIDGGHEFLHGLYDKVLVPPTVLRELAAGPFGSGEAYLSHFRIENLLQVKAPGRSNRDVTEHLDPSEQEAIELAVGFPLLIEKEAGPTVARVYRLVGFHVADDPAGLGLFGAVAISLSRTGGPNATEEGGGVIRGLGHDGRSLDAEMQS